MSDYKIDSWTDFKALCTKKVGSMQYRTITGDYEIWFSDNGDKYIHYITIENPAGTDQEDFEDNYKDDCNQASHPKTTDGVSYVRATAKTVGLMMHLHGGEFTAAADTTTKHQMKFTGNVEIVGAIMKVSGAHHGDKVNVKVVDVDNLLGYGANTVLAQFAIDVPAEMLTEHISVESSTSDLIMAGLYMSMEYENTHASETADIHYAYKYYK